MLSRKWHETTVYPKTDALILAMLCPGSYIIGKVAILDAMCWKTI